MGLTRRELLTLPLCVGLASACSHTMRSSNFEHETQELASVTTAGRRAPAILVFTPDTPQTKEVWSGLRDELGKDWLRRRPKVRADVVAAVVAERESGW